MNEKEEKKEMDIKDEQAHYSLPDWFLQELVSMINETPGKGAFPITLNTGGIIISGILIGVHEYFESFAKEFSSVIQDEEKRNYFKEYFESFGKLLAEKPENRMPPAYIHLRDARLYCSTNRPIPTDEGILWRGRISCIDGFFLRELTAGETPAT